MSKTVALIPRMSEKSYGLSQTKNVFAIEVPQNINKLEIARAIASQFEVTVTGVRIINMKGKSKRTISKKGRVVIKGRSNAFKKAYVTLKTGDSLPFFAAVEAEEAKEQETQEKVTKAMAKQAEKEAKPARRGLRRRAKKDEETK